MCGIKEVEHVVSDFPSNQIFIAEQLYKQKFSDRMTEASFYKALERLCRSEKLLKVAKGTYCRPKSGKYGIVPPSDEEITHVFTKDGTGMVIGYTLYNSLRLTTQIGKRIDVLTASIQQNHRTIDHVYLEKCPLQFTEDVKAHIEMLEILLHFKHIQDLNYHLFKEYAEAFSKQFKQGTFDAIYKNRKYPKRTIAFLRNVLNYYGISNDLNRYLSSLSQYDFPRMETMYEAA